jgi:hypothetical protein
MSGFGASAVGTFEIPTDSHPWALKKLIRVFERILHDDKWTSRGRSCFIGIQQSGTKRGAGQRVKESPLYISPAGEGFRRVFAEIANLFRAQGAKTRATLFDIA